MNPCAACVYVRTIAMFVCLILSLFVNEADHPSSQPKAPRRNILIFAYPVVLIFITLSVMGIVHNANKFFN